LPNTTQFDATNDLLTSDLGPATRSLSPSAQDPSDETFKVITVHKAHLQDARSIFDLVNSLSHDGTLLRRSYAEICENIRDFTVACIPNPEGEHEFIGCGALHLYGPHLAEVRSIVVKPEARGLGAGDAILEALIAEAADHEVMSVCLFTRIPTFFEHLGFRVAERDAMPDKIYKDCQTCPRLYACDEVAMVRGPLPNIAVLGPRTIQRPELVGENHAGDQQLVQLTGTHR
jgi:amino-acid N-acetyltransferase